MSIEGEWVYPAQIEVGMTIHGDIKHSEVLHIGLVQDGRYAFTVQDQYGDLDYPALNPDTEYYVTRQKL